MVSIISFLFILIVSAIVTKVATIALIHTGLSRQMARFQATSAFTGVGYPGKESEYIINHPVRRKIILVLMLLGKAGLVSIIATFLITFLRHQEDDFLQLWQKIALLVSATALVWFLFTSTYFDLILSRIINWMLKRFSKLQIKDYASILHLSGEFEIAELRVEKDNWLSDKKLIETGLRQEGITVMGINRKDGTFIGAPGGATKIKEGDLLIIYGRSDNIKDLDQRKQGVKGKLAHEVSIEENKKVLEEQLQRDPVSKEEARKSYRNHK